MKKPTNALVRELKKRLKEHAAATDEALSRASKNFDAANFCAASSARQAQELNETLRVERVGRRAMLESLRAERARLVHELYVCEQRLAVLRDTERGLNGALSVAETQVENTEGERLIRAK